jgi:hypothetical protein
MPRKAPSSGDLSKLQTLPNALAQAIEYAARGLRPLLAREKVAGLDLETAILTRGRNGAVAHCPIKLRRTIRVADLSKRPHVVGVLIAMGRSSERVTAATLDPGTYAVKLRPVGHDQFAFDLLRSDGKRALAVPALQTRGKPPPTTAIARFYGIDIEINPLDDIINPFHTYICFSFLWWRGCLNFPTPTFPYP